MMKIKTVLATASFTALIAGCQHKHTPGEQILMSAPRSGHRDDRRLDAPAPAPTDTTAAAPVTPVAPVTPAAPETPATPPSVAVTLAPATTPVSTAPVDRGPRMYVAPMPMTLPDSATGPLGQPVR